MPVRLGLLELIIICSVPVVLLLLLGAVVGISSFIRSAQKTDKREDDLGDKENT